MVNGRRFAFQPLSAFRCQKAEIRRRSAYNSARAKVHPSDSGRFLTGFSMTQSLPTEPAPSSPLSDNLPPVQPPTAGFIVQLFVVPGLIVLAVIAVWALFGQIAASEQDWKTLVEELKSSNGHTRNRAMYGLAQVLDQDRRRGEKGAHLASNPEIASALSDQLTRELKSNTNSKDSLAIQQYLTRAIGLLDAPEATMASLRLSLESTRDVEIRKSGAASIAMIAGRAFEKGTPLDDPDTVRALIESSADSLPIMRQTAAFALGLFRTPDAAQHLRVLLGNPDRNTSVNAAVALARQGSPDGLGVFKEALTRPVPESQEEQLEHYLILTNSLKAVSQLGDKMTDVDRAEFREILERLAADHREVRVRVDAQNALQSLKTAAR